MSEITNPQDAELEEVVLGACLLESKAITLVAGILRPEVFYTETNREIYAALQSMYHAGQVIDIMTIKRKICPAWQARIYRRVLYKLNNRYAIFMPKQVTRQTSWLPILE